MRRLVVAVAAVAVIAVLGWWVASSPPAAGRGAAVIPGTVDPFVIEVLNGTRIDGLARRTTHRLRRQGIDVVYFGSAAMDTLQQTRIVIRRGDSLAAVRVRSALGVGTVTVEPDESLLLDLTVLLGSDAAREPLDP